MPDKNALEASPEKLWTKNFIIIILMNLLVFMNHIMILSTFPFYIQDLGGSSTLAGIAAFLFSAIAVIFRPFIGWALNNGRRRRILCLGLIGMSLMPIGYLISSLIALSFVFRMVHGASLAASNTTTATLATDNIPKTRFAEGMGMFGLATALATAGAPALGLFIMNRFGYGPLFGIAAGFTALSLVLFLLIRHPDIRVKKVPFSAKGLINADAMPASVTALIFMLTFGALENFTAKFASDNGLPSGGLFFTIMAVMLFITRATTGKTADRRGEGIFVYTCNLSMFAAFLLMAFVPNTVTFFLAAVLAGYGFGGLEPALQSMAVRIAKPEERGSANSTFLCAYDIGIGLGGGLAGVLIDASGYSEMYAVIALANIASILVYFFWARKHPSSFSYERRQKGIQKEKETPEDR